MENNKPTQKKNKQIKKNKLEKLKPKNKSKKNFSFQAEMLDLISESEEPIVQEQKQQGQVQGLAQIIIEKNEKDLGCRQIISNNEYYYVVTINKYYRVRLQNQMNQYRINSLNSDQFLIINGKKTNQFTPQHSFVFILSRQPDSQFNKIEKYLKKMVIQHQELVKKPEFSINFKQETILRSSHKIYLQETVQPWNNLPECVISNDPMMIIGLKNTGKSMLGEYLINTRQSECVLLDCDIGRNSCLQGCVSLTSNGSTKKIWIGELTPLNNLQTYLRAVKYLFEFYRQNWFTKKLIINTMGYTTGLGQFLFYEIYQIIKPRSILALSSSQSGQFNTLNNIIKNIQTGQYINKLFVSKSALTNKSVTTSDIYYYENVHSQIKKGLSRFEKTFEVDHRKIAHICDLLQLIRQSYKSGEKDKLKFKSRTKIAIYEQSRHAKQEIEGQEVVSYRRLDNEESVDMRLIVLGKMVSMDPEFDSKINNGQETFSGKLFQVHGLGFGFDSKIYFKQQQANMIGIVNEGMDFQKGFYHLNQKQLIDLQLRNGKLNYIMVSSKALGSKGVRNNPSKVM